MTQLVPASVGFTWLYPPCISSLLLQVKVPKEVALFVRLDGGFVKLKVSMDSDIADIKPLIIAHPSFKHLDEQTMNIRFVAHSGKGIPTLEAEGQTGNVIDLKSSSQTLEEAITELQGKVPGTDVSKLFFVVSSPASAAVGREPSPCSLLHLLIPS